MTDTADQIQFTGTCRVDPEYHHRISAAGVVGTFSLGDSTSNGHGQRSPAVTVGRNGEQPIRIKIRYGQGVRREVDVIPGKRETIGQFHFLRVAHIK